MIEVHVKTPFTASADPSVDASVKMAVAVGTHSPTDFTYREAGLADKAREFLRVSGFTFQKIDVLYQEYLSPVMKNVVWEAKDEHGQVCVFNTPEFITAQHKRRHWLLAAQDIELADFREWLPPAHDHHGTGRIDCSAMYGTNGGDGPDIFMKAGQAKEAIVAAQLEITYFPFCPHTTFHTRTVLAKCLASSHKMDEATAVFQEAREEAHRLRMVFWESAIAREWEAVSKGAGAE